MEPLTEDQEHALGDAVGRAVYCTLSPHEWVWTQKESLQMARGIILLSQLRSDLENEVKQLNALVADLRGEV